MPPWADSLMSSTSGEPSAEKPIGTRSRSAADRACVAHSLCTSWLNRSVMPSIPVSSKSAASGSVVSAEALIRYGETSRASVVAEATAMASGRPSAVAVSVPLRSFSTISTARPVTRSRRPRRSGFHSSAPRRSRIVALR